MVHHMVDAATSSLDRRHLERAAVAMDAFFRDDPYMLTRHHIDSYDRFLDRGVASIVRGMRPISLLKRDDRGREVLVELLVATREVRVDSPTVADGGDTSSRRLRPLLPNEARLRDLTYAVGVFADVRVRYTVDGALHKEVDFARPVCLGRVPLMLHSRHCALHGQSREALRELGECPDDRGGYFVVDGKEKVLVAQEEPVRNRLYVRRGEASTPDVALQAFVRSDSPRDSFPRTTTFYVRSATAPTRPGVVSVVAQHLGSVRSTHGAGAAGRVHGAAPLFVLFRALGVESDRDIFEHVVPDADAPSAAAVLEWLRPSALEAVALGVTDQRTARAWLQRLVDPSRHTLKMVLTDDLFPNAGGGAGRGGLAVQALALGAFVAKIARAALSSDTLDAFSRDDYANKRLQLSGFLIEDLFRDVYLRVRGAAVRRLDSEWASGAWRTGGDVTRLVTEANLGQMLESPMLSERMRRSMKGDWGTGDSADDAAADDRDARGGLVQDLSRVSYMTYVSHVRRLSSDTDPSIKLRDPHMLRGSHWGAVCPVESPDGPSVGLLNHLATTARVSMGDDAAAARAAVLATALAVPLVPVPALALALAPSGEDEGKEDDGLQRRRRPSRAWFIRACKVHVNDVWFASAEDPPALLRALRAARRGGALPRDASLAWRVFDGEMHVHVDRGRFMRPLVTLVPDLDDDDDAGAPRPALRDGMPLVPLWDAVDRAAAQRRTLQWNELLEAPRGSSPSPTAAAAAMPALEEVDVEELLTLLVAMYPSDIVRQPSARFTHCELHPTAAMMSVSAAAYPLMNHNNAPYNCFSLAQFKQAVDVYSTAFLGRMDTHGMVLHHPQRPLVSTDFADRLRGGHLAHGENLVVAVMTASGYNQEDAVVLNRASVERGRMHLTCYETHRFEEQQDEQGTLVFGNPLKHEADGVRAGRSYEALEPSGMPRLGAVLHEGDVMLGRVRIEQQVATGLATGAGAGAGAGSGAGQSQQVASDRSVVAGRKRHGIVDRVVLLPLPLPLPLPLRMCKVRLRELRQPELGDKLASRYGQKGVVGMLLPATDMPFLSSNGTSPDIVFNPHGMPKRMTVTHLFESLLGKAAAVAGARYNANSFEGRDAMSEARAALAAAGLHDVGEEVLCNGRTGEQIACNVFVGSNYYGRLKHMVADKHQSRARGPVNAITMQPSKPAEGGGSGGLRVGEMEKDAMLAHGMSAFLKESLMERSDRRRVLLDADEGVPLLCDAPDAARALPGAGLDGGPPAGAAVEMPHAFRLLQAELQAMSIGTRVRVRARAQDRGNLRDHDDAVVSSDDDDDESVRSDGASTASSDHDHDPADLQQMRREDADAAIVDEDRDDDDDEPEPGDDSV